MNNCNISNRISILKHNDFHSLYCLNVQENMINQSAMIDLISPVKNKMLSIKIQLTWVERPYIMSYSSIKVVHSITKLGLHEIGLTHVNLNPDYSMNKYINQ